MSLSKKTVISMRPEIYLILYCVRINLTQKEKKQIEILLEKELNWEYVINVANQHRVLPLIYMNLVENFKNDIPIVIFDRLRYWYHTNTIQNKLISRELSRLQEYFLDANIPMIPFKGPTSAILIYGNIGLRQFNDLDILVHEKDYNRAQKILTELGYSKKSDWEFECGFQHGSSGINVDLHRKFDKHELYTEFDFKRLLSRLESSYIENQKIPALSVEDTLIHLCVNFAKDLFINKNKLSQICDIANLIDNHQNQDWLTVIKRTGACGTQRILFLCLLLSKQLFGTNLPEEVLKELKRHPQLKSLVPEVYNRILNLVCGKSQFLKVQGGYFANKILHLKLKERLRDRIPIYRQIIRYYYHFYTNKIIAAVLRIISPIIYRRV